MELTTQRSLVKPTIPIVFTGIGNPVEKGLVASLTRPGGDITGFSNSSAELTPKRLELICELVPRDVVAERQFSHRSMARAASARFFLLSTVGAKVRRGANSPLRLRLR